MELNEPTQTTEGHRKEVLLSVSQNTNTIQESTRRLNGTARSEHVNANNWRFHHIYHQRGEDKT